MCQTENYGNAQTPSAGLGQQAGQRNDEPVRTKLLRRKWQLESDLREVENALNDLSDPTVQKVINIVTIAEKR